MCFRAQNNYSGFKVCVIILMGGWVPLTKYAEVAEFGRRAGLRILCVTIQQTP